MPETQISDLLETHFSGEWGRAEPAVGLVPVAVLRSTNLNNGGVDYSSAAERHLERSKAESKGLRMGDLMLEAAGGGPGTPVGRTALFNPPDSRIYVVSNFFKTLRPAPGVSSEFLAHALAHMYATPSIWAVQQQTTGIINLKFADYLKCRIFAPALEEQRYIVEILDTTDETIRATQHIIGKLSELQNALMQDLAHQAQTYETSSMSEVLDRVIDYRGKTPPYSKSGIAVVSAENIGGGEVRSTTKYVTPATYQTWTTRGFPQPGDTIITTEAPTGEIAQLPGDKTYLLTRRVIGLGPSEGEVSPDYLFWYLRQLSASGYFSRTAHGTTVPRLLKPDIMSTPIHLPPINDQAMLVDPLITLMARLAALRRELNKLRQLRQGLADDLLSGRLATVTS